MEKKVSIYIYFLVVLIYFLWMNESICVNAKMSKKEWQSCQNYMLGPPDRDQVNKLLLMHETIIFLQEMQPYMDQKLVDMLKKY